MSKGEFEKRIKWLEENPEKDAGKLISRVTASAFREIVDEARQEAPKFGDFTHERPMI